MPRVWRDADKVFHEDSKKQIDQEYKKRTILQLEVKPKKILSPISELDCTTIIKPNIKEDKMAKHDYSGFVKLYGVEGTKIDDKMVFDFFEYLNGMRTKANFAYLLKGIRLAALNSQLEVKHQKGDYIFKSFKLASEEKRNTERVDSPLKPTFIEEYVPMPHDDLLHNTESTPNKTIEADNQPDAKDEDVNLNPTDDIRTKLFELSKGIDFLIDRVIETRELEDIKVAFDSLEKLFEPSFDKLLTKISKNLDDIKDFNAFMARHEFEIIVTGVQLVEKNPAPSNSLDGFLTKAAKPIESIFIKSIQPDENAIAKSKFLKQQHEYSKKHENALVLVKCHNCGNVIINKFAEGEEVTCRRCQTTTTLPNELIKAEYECTSCERFGFIYVVENETDGLKCKECDAPVEFVWNDHKKHYSSVNLLKY